MEAALSAGARESRLARLAADQAASEPTAEPQIERELERVKLAEQQMGVNQDDAALHLEALIQQKHSLVTLLQHNAGDEGLRRKLSAIESEIQELSCRCHGTPMSILEWPASYKIEPELAVQLVLQAVERVPVFKLLGHASPAFSTSIAAALRPMRLRPGQILLAAGQGATELVFVMRGQLRQDAVAGLTGKINSSSARVVCPGEHVGGALDSLMRESPVAVRAPIVACTEAQLLVLTQHSLLEIASTFGRAFEDVLCSAPGTMEREAATAALLFTTANNAKVQQSTSRRSFASVFRNSYKMNTMDCGHSADAMTIQRIAELGAFAEDFRHTSAVAASSLLGELPLRPAGGVVALAPQNWWRDNLEHVVQYPKLISKGVKHQIRRGIPQPYRRLVWLRLSGAEKLCRGDYDGHYWAACRACFNLDDSSTCYSEHCQRKSGADDDPKSCARVPTNPSDLNVVGKYPCFGGELRRWEWLSDRHFEAAKRLLLVIEGSDDKLEYCPALPSIMCLFLQALSEAEVYCVILALVDRSWNTDAQPKLPHFQLTQV